MKRKVRNSQILDIPGFLEFYFNVLDNLKLREYYDY